VGRRLILDTNILIAYERGTIDRSSLDDDELAIASVSVAEYRVGIELADTASRAAERARALVAIMSAVDVLDYTQATAAHHGRLLAHVRRSGSPRAAHDLIIAAHAAETGRMIMSRDAKARFGDLPGVSAIDVLHPNTEVVGHLHLKPSGAVSGSSAGKMHSCTFVAWLATMRNGLMTWNPGFGAEAVVGERG